MSGGRRAVLRHGARHALERLRRPVERAGEAARDAPLGVEQQRRGGFGKLARLAAELVVAPARARAELRHAHRLHDLVIGELRGECGCHERIGLDLARAARAGDAHQRVQRREDERPVGRRVGVREAAADRAAIAHRAVRHHARHLGERLAARERPVLELGVRDRGADAPGIAFISISLSEAILEISIKSFGRARRRLSIGPSDWPPAIAWPRRPPWRSARERLGDVAWRGQ